MFAHRTLARSILGLVALFGLTSSAFAQEYNVVLSRPDSVGTKYTIAVTGESSQTQTLTVANGAPQKRVDKFTIQIEGMIHVLAVDEQKQATRVEFTVAKCLKNDKPLYEPGTVIVAASGKGKTDFTVNGAAAPADAVAALGMAIMTHQPGEPTDNEIFGTARPQPVGGTWPINLDAATQVARRSGVPVDKNNVKGDAKLVGIQTVNGKEALQVEADMTVTNLSGAMPNGAQLETGSSAAHFSALLPNDSTSQPISQSQSMQIKLSMVLTGPQGQKANLLGELERKSKVVYGEAGK